MAVVLGAVALAGSVAIWLADRGSAVDAWAAVLHPLRHLSAPPLPDLRLRAETTRVRRGRELPVTIEAARRDSVQLVWQPEGEMARARWYAVTTGAVHASVPRIEVNTRVWAAADGATSDTLDIAAFDPLVLLDVKIALDYPPHTRREREVVTSPLPLIEVPEGTRAVVAGKTTRPVDRVALRDSTGRRIALETDGERRFQGAFAVRAGDWGWDVRGAAGDTLEGEPDSLRFRILADSAPQVTIAYPGVDTVLSTEMTQPLLIELRDDFGLSAAELVSWRVSAWGESWPPLVETLELEGDDPRLGLAALIDAQGRGFLPGDTLRYLVQAYDNAPQPQLGKSREYVLRLPSLDEVRKRSVAEARELVESAERLAERAREQEASTRTLERSSEFQSAPGARRPPERGSAGVEFRDTEAARRALEEASQLVEEAQQIQEALRELAESIERAGLNDPSVLERLREIEALYERILTPELREKIEALREALVELDAERIRQAIRELAEGSVNFRERVEQSLELLKRAALEQEFLAFEASADELSEAHQQMAEAASELAERGSDSLTAQVERRADELVGRADALAEELSRFTQELQQADEAAAAERTAEAGERSAEVARLDEQVADALPSQRPQAAATARRAAEQMGRAVAALREGREQMQQSWRQQVVQALERTQAEALELARRQRAMNERLSSTGPRERATLRSEEVALKRGVDQIGEQLSEAARSSLLLDPALVETAGQVSQALQELLDQMGDARRSGRGDRRLGEQVSEGLNELTYQLMQAADAAASAASGTGLQEALEQLAQLAQQQGELNAQAGGMTPGAYTDAILQRLRELAGRQQAIGEELSSLDRSLGSRGRVLGRLDELAGEAEDLARELERGRLDEQIIERQNRLFQRLLDAGRTLEQDEYERERRAERPGVTEILRPGELPPELLRGVPFPHPSEEALRQYPPALRRLILEYFDRLNRRESSGAP